MTPLSGCPIAGEGGKGLFLSRVASSVPGQCLHKGPEQKEHSHHLSGGT